MMYSSVAASSSTQSSRVRTNNPIVCAATLLLIIISTFVTGAAANNNNVARPVWNILHGNEGPVTMPSADAFKDSGVLTLDHLKENIAKHNVNAVELDMIFHVESDQFFLAHDHYACDTPEGHPRRVGCYELVPYLKEVEANANISLLWVDPKGMSLWGNKTLGDLAILIREYVHTKEIWWGLGAGRSLQDRDLETLAETGMGENEGVSFDYGKCCEYRCTVQDLYLRARRAGINNVGYANKPGFFSESCTELNKALAYKAEGKLSRVFSFTFSEATPISKLYEVEEGETMSTGCGLDGDEEFLVAGVDGVISNANSGVESHSAVIANNNQTIRLANSTFEKLWQNQTTDGNLIANFGAEMPTLSNNRASSWKWIGENKPLSYSQGMCKDFPAHSGTRYFAVGQIASEGCGAATEIYQDTVIRAYEPEIVAGLTNVTYSAYFKSISPSSMSITIKFLNDDAVELASATVSPTSSDKNTWVYAGETVTVPTGARIVRTVIRGSRCSLTPADPCAELVDTVSMKFEVEQLDAPLPYDWKSTKDIGCCDLDDFDWEMPAIIAAAVVLNVAAAYVFMKTFVKRRRARKVTVSLDEGKNAPKDVDSPTTNNAPVQHQQVVLVMPEHIRDDEEHTIVVGTPLVTPQMPIVDATSVFVYPMEEGEWHRSTTSSCCTPTTTPTTKKDTNNYSVTVMMDHKNHHVVQLTPAFPYGNDEAEEEE